MTAYLDDLALSVAREIERLFDAPWTGGDCQRLAAIHVAIRSALDKARCPMGDGKQYEQCPRSALCFQYGCQVQEKSKLLLDAERTAISEHARYYASLYKPYSDGRNTFVMFANWIDARAEAQQ